tara:strand:+ start:1933 stop:2568 length:636 start_codon:yes stop_codon:yes gene_type:complete
MPYSQGPAGQLEFIIDTAETNPSNSDHKPRGIVVFAHPHPLHGGNMHNKVVYRSAKALSAIGFTVIRFNFRGVGSSNGTFDNGLGEMDDYRAMLDLAQTKYQNIPLFSAGYSFGAWIALHTGATDPRVYGLLGIAPAIDKDMSLVKITSKPIFLVHGEEDQLFTIKQMWKFYSSLSEPKDLVIIDSADHLFNGKTQEVSDAVRDLWEDFEV